MSEQDIFLIVLGVILVIVVLLVLRSRPKEPPIKADERDVPEAKPADALSPTKPLDDRMEVEAPVEINENMSLAEIKRAKAARVKGKERRETAVEATAAARAELAEPEAPTDDPSEDADAPAKSEEGSEAPAAVEPEKREEVSADVSAGWDLFDDEEDDLGFDLPSSSSAEEPIEAKEPEPEPEPEPAPSAVEEPEAVEQPEAVEEPVGLDQMSESLGTPLSEGLARTRSGFIDRLGKLFRKETLDEEIVDDVEEVLYTADIGTRAASQIMGALEDHLSGDEKRDPQAVWTFVREFVTELLKKRQEPLDIDAANPYVILVIGVNGVGKTTTIGKMAAKFRRQGKKVLLVAGDTFRAAAVEQIAVWGDRADIPVHSGDSNADPASVVYSGVERGKKEGFDVVICDTAGRLHTKAPLLDELRKIHRVTTQVIPEAPHETMLVLDANTGQNAIQQAKMFNEAVDITGIVLTKLDGTAKGGVILGICDELDAPIRYIGIGESVADLRQFDADDFVEALFM